MMIMKDLKKEVKDLKEAGYEVARNRSIPSIGQQLKAVYQKVIR